MEAKEILQKYKHYAVLGVTQNTDKFGYKVFKRLIEKGYETYGVSPIYKEVDGIPLYESLEDINAPIDVVVFVVNKKYALEYIKQMTDIGIQYAWMQPGTYDDELLDHMKNVGVTAIEACILVETKDID